MLVPVPASGRKQAVGSPPAANLDLPPEATSVGAARHWLSEQLADWSSTGLESVVLVLSELVTNAILHARTTVQVFLQRDGNVARLEVTDKGSALPVAKEYGATAYTGRGLHLVETLSRDWGVQTAVGAKIVWAEVVDASPARKVSSRPRAHVPAPPESGPPRRQGRATVPAPEDLVTVRILAMPLGPYLEAQEHNDAILREFALLVGALESHSVPARLIDLASQVRRFFAPATDKLREQVEQAVARGDKEVDLLMQVPRRAWSAFDNLSSMLDEADRYCEEGGLLTLASSPTTRRFRSWYTEEVRSQLTGRAPQRWPWPGKGPPGNQQKE
jgi:anti-sigma regulatory factor (Ser/Thr protein kinase)